MEKFEALNVLNQVADFHRTFHHPMLNIPVIPEESRCNLRVDLISEELNELKDAINKKDIILVADALCDLQYVISGAVLEFGLAEKFNRLFGEVHRSNMSKACISENEAQATVKFYQEKEGTNCFYEKSEGNFLVYRKNDKKTLKSINYSPADLKPILIK